MGNIQVNQVYYPKQPLKTAQNQETTKSSFADQLKQTLQSQVSFSHHAKVRLQQHGISLSDHQLQKLNDGVASAREKGSKESLMLMKDLAFVVSVKNNKVITAMKQDSMENQIVTNIDSALIL
ncbi:TIGR02530 family flagellar biosynthesis protein [Guptibacillus hwajinpoensis]|uniref:TIGR02530 family flagellar biosynthesis protein n=1 Tax=Guptibacillus hwajinpoensis TaxID=208199 RepID=UPI00069D1DB1|nr:TIGR02530 family flagellar biosynthesis protein [Alkalihalobacillus macyae]